MAVRELRDPLRAIRRRLALPGWVRRMDDRVAHAINHRTVHPAVDRGYSALSRRADRGVLWLMAAGLLVVFGRFRPALRGLASLAVASLLANLVGKNVFGGERPHLAHVPVARQLLTSPTSPSFPSGHSASAAAFVTGVALESPRAGAVLAPLAAAVAYSRMHTGAHWFSDVVGGVALGAFVATVGKAVVPARGGQSGSSASASALALPARPDGDGVFIVVNRSSGAGRGEAEALELLARRLPRARVHRLGRGEDAGAAVRAAVDGENPPTVLGAYGGDGTIGAVASLARRNDLPLLVLPGGTFNHFAKTAQIPSVDTGIDALQAGAGRTVDVAELVVGQAEPITVLNTASVGIYPDFVEARERLERRVGKPIAALVAAVGAVSRADPVTVSINGRTARVWSIFVGVGRYGAPTAVPRDRDRLDDGVLDVRVLHAGRRARTRGVVALALGRHLPKPPVIDAFTTDAVTVRLHAGPGPATGFAHDGEASVGAGANADADTRQATARILPGGLRIYAPAAPR
ncbi:phosphatase PAP2 family protein [Glaciibacter sp. 2TAF33]|uniref:phosphatase PAP2 family protein n=1 Tax=Glaciibacter sp. 2TAF33 TaxID=3233015 RepID=UPI003F914CB1